MKWSEHLLRPHGCSFTPVMPYYSFGCCNFPYLDMKWEKLPKHVRWGKRRKKSGGSDTYWEVWDSPGELLRVSSASFEGRWKFHSMWVREIEELLPLFFNSNDFNSISFSILICLLDENMFWQMEVKSDRTFYSKEEKNLSDLYIMK